MRRLAALRASLRALTIAALVAGGPARAQPPSDADDDAAWAKARATATAEALQRYLESFPVGRHVDEALQGLVEERIETEAGSADERSGDPSKGDGEP